jgi:hypothetical protein
VNLWMKRAIGAAAVGGGLLALGAGAAGAQEVSADASARLGRPTAAQVRVCADGRVLSRLLGSCSGQSGTSATVRAGDGIRGEVRASRLASADASVGTRPAASAQASAATRSEAATADADAAAGTSPQAGADADASLSRPRAARLLRLRPLVSPAGVGLLGTSPFTLVGDPTSGALLQLGDLTLGDLAGEAPTGIGVLDSGPIASGNQVDVDAGDVSPSAPVTVCGNSAGVLGDASASCGASRPSAGSAAPAGNAAAGSGSASQGNPSSDSLLDGLASGNQVDAGIGDISPSVPVMVCGNSAGVLGDASAGCGAGQQASSSGTSSGTAQSSAGVSAGTGSTDGSLLDGAAGSNQVDAGVGSVSPSVPVTVCGNAVGEASASCGAGQQASSGGTTAPSGGAGGSSSSDSSGSQAGASVESVSASVPVTVCGNGVGLLGDASVSCAADTSTGGIIAPPPGTTTPGSTDTDGTQGSPGSTGTSGIPGTTGLTSGASGEAGDPANAFAPLRSALAGADTLAFTGAAADLLAAVAAGLLVAGVLIVRAARPATAATEGGEDR